MTWSGIENFEQEVRFHPTRKWRFDFAFSSLDPPVAIEIEGGAESHGRRGHKSRHLTPGGFREDCIKYNAATELGWRVYRFTGAQVRDLTALRFVEALLKGKEVLADEL